jgi:hypothetical protein
MLVMGALRLEEGLMAICRSPWDWAAAATPRALSAGPASPRASRCPGRQTVTEWLHGITTLPGVHRCEPICNRGCGGAVEPIAK